MLDTAHRLYYPSCPSDCDPVLARLVCIAAVGTSAIEAVANAVLTAGYAVALTARVAIRIMLTGTSLVMGGIWVLLYHGVLDFSPAVWMTSLVTNWLVMVRYPDVLWNNFVLWSSLSVDQLVFTKWLFATAWRVDTALGRFACDKKLGSRAYKVQRLTELACTALLYGLWDPARVIEKGDQLRLGPSPPKALAHRVAKLGSHLKEKLEVLADEAMNLAFSYPFVSLGVGTTTMLYVGSRRNGVELPAYALDVTLRVTVYFLDFVTGVTTGISRHLAHRVDPAVLGALRVSIDKLEEQIKNRANA